MDNGGWNTNILTSWVFSFVLSNRGAGVIILNFVGDVLANLFLSGMFVRRLFLHIRLSKSVMTRQNRLIEHIARKSLMCLIFTFVINLAMNLLKLTRFIGDRSDVSHQKTQHQVHSLYSSPDNTIGIHRLF